MFSVPTLLVRKRAGLTVRSARHAAWSWMSALQNVRSWAQCTHPERQRVVKRRNSGSLTPSMIFTEAGNSEALRNLWMSAINGGADMVQIITWNDYSEGTEISPSTGTRFGFYDLATFYTQWFKLGKPEIVRDALPASLELGITALLVALVLGLAVGFSGVARPEGKLDLSGRLYGIGTYALPVFWAAMVMQLIFAVGLGWFPVGGRFPPTALPPQGTGFYLLDGILQANPQVIWGTLQHLALPAITLGLLLSGIFERALRLNLRRALRSDYVEAARSRGISERRVVLRHALPNALLPVLTITGITVASLIGGALLIELIFSWPGIAYRLQEAIAQRDYPLVQGIVVVIAALVVMVNLAVDVVVALLDPRLKF